MVRLLWVFAHAVLRDTDHAVGSCCSHTCTSKWQAAAPWPLHVKPRQSLLLFRRPTPPGGRRAIASCFRRSALQQHHECWMTINTKRKALPTHLEHGVLLRGLAGRADGCCFLLSARPPPQRLPHRGVQLLVARLPRLEVPHRRRHHRHDGVDKGALQPVAQQKSFRNESLRCQPDNHPPS